MSGTQPSYPPIPDYVRQAFACWITRYQHTPQQIFHWAQQIQNEPGPSSSSQPYVQQPGVPVPAYQPENSRHQQRLSIRRASIAEQQQQQRQHRHQQQRSGNGMFQTPSSPTNVLPVNHARQHSESAAPDHFCPLCWHYVVDLRGLRRHFREVCDQSRRWECQHPRCSHTEKRGDRAKSHHIRAHGCTEVVPGNGPVCPYSPVLVTTEPRAALGCGYCLSVFEKKPSAFATHLSEHFHSGDTQQNWVTSVEISSLLQRAEVQPRWVNLLAEYGWQQNYLPQLWSTAEDQRQLINVLQTAPPEVLIDDLRRRLCRTREQPMARFGVQRPSYTDDSAPPGFSPPTSGLPPGYNMDMGSGNAWDNTDWSSFGHAGTGASNNYLGYSNSIASALPGRHRTSSHRSSRRSRSSRRDDTPGRHPSPRPSHSSSQVVYTGGAFDGQPKPPTDHSAMLHDITRRSDSLSESSDIVRRVTDLSLTSGDSSWSDKSQLSSRFGRFGRQGPNSRVDSPSWNHVTLRSSRKRSSLPSSHPPFEQQPR